MSDNRTSPSVQSRKISATLIKGLDVLTVLTSQPVGLTQAELVRIVNEPRSNVLRLVESLALYGLVERRERRWKLADAFHTWALPDRHRVMRNRYRPVLERVARATGELVLLGLHEGNGVVHLDYIESDHAIRVAPAPQTRHNLRVNALGKLALSRRPDLSIRITDRKLKAELETIRRSGVAWNREESVRGMIALAHPGFINTPSEPMLAVAWPAMRFSENKARQALRAIRTALKV